MQGVKDVDTGIKIMLHIDRGGDKGGYTGAALNTSSSFITNAQNQGVVLDVFGESCYQAYQGDPASTTNCKVGNFVVRPVNVSVQSVLVFVVLAGSP